MVFWRETDSEWAPSDRKAFISDQIDCSPDLPCPGLTSVSIYYVIVGGGKGGHSWER